MNATPRGLVSLIAFQHGVWEVGYIGYVGYP